MLLHLFFICWSAFRTAINEPLIARFSVVSVFGLLVPNVLALLSAKRWQRHLHTLIRDHCRESPKRFIFFDSVLTGCTWCHICECCCWIGFNYWNTILAQSQQGVIIKIDMYTSSSSCIRTRKRILTCMQCRIRHRELKNLFSCYRR